MKKINMKKIFAAVFAVMFGIFGVFGASSRVVAAGRAIALSPTSQKIVLVPGETYRGGFDVVNPSSSESDLHYVVTTSTFSQVAGTESKDSYGDVDFNTKTTKNMIVDWTSVSNPKGVVVPNGQETVSYTITVPYDAPAGGQYMAFLVREDPEYIESNKDSMAVKEVMQMAFVIYAEVAGETHKDAEITENNIPAFLLTNQLDATSMVKNNGNIHTDATYILQVWPMFSDEEICTNEEDVSTSFVLPETERYHTETCNLPTVGLFRAKQTVKIFGEESVVERTVIVCPLWMLFLILFGVIALVIWLFMITKRRKNTK